MVRAHVQKQYDRDRNTQKPQQNSTSHVIPLQRRMSNADCDSLPQNHARNRRPRPAQAAP